MHAQIVVTRSSHTMLREELANALAVHKHRGGLIQKSIRRHTRRMPKDRLANQSGGSIAQEFVVEPGNSSAVVRSSETQIVNTSPTFIS